MSNSSPPLRASSILERLSHAPDPDSSEPSNQELSILRQALESFAKRGYTATNLRAIAANADVTAPMINYYFGTKEALYERLSRIVLASLHERVVASVATVSSFREKLVAVLMAHLDYARESPTALAFIVDLTYGAAEGRPLVDLGPVYAATRSQIASVFSAAGGSGEFVPSQSLSITDAAATFCALLDRTVLRVFEGQRNGHPTPTRKTVERDIDVLFRGIGRAHPKPRAASPSQRF